MTLLSHAQIEQRRAAGRARAAKLTSEQQSAFGSLRSRESLATAGHAGYLAQLAKYGPNYAAEQLAKWRRKHPTNLERIIIGWLKEWREVFDRDVYIAGYYVDFLLPWDIIIEADSIHWHQNNDHHGQDREGMDAQRERKITAAGYTFIRLAEKDILDGSAKEPLRARLDALTLIPF